MLPPEVTAAIRRLIVAVSAGDYGLALTGVSAIRCSAADISRAVKGYDRVFSAPPLADWNVVPILSDDGLDRWSIRAPSWSEDEGGRSDLELFLTASSAGGVTVEFDDIRVA